MEANKIEAVITSYSIHYTKLYDKKIGISQFVVGSPIGTNVKQAIDLVGKKIIPQFKN